MSATGGISSASSFWTRSLGSSAASAAGQGKAASGSQAAASSNTATQSGNSNAPAGSGTAADGSKLTDAQRQQVDKLKSVDRSVRAHEAAHKAAGGPYAGSATYTFSTGPDGQHYATAGEVSIDTSVVQGDPRATISKLETVRRAALAPADPSGQDRAVAAQAAAGIAAAQAQEAKQTNAKDDGATDGKGGGGNAADASPSQGSSAGDGTIGAGGITNRQGAAAYRKTQGAADASIVQAAQAAAQPLALVI
ncbi:MAG: putative metalloprotease CJM1_0395 family protein [Azospirillaceae bacterium]|nr:putative metalloprotease CJM1_0395 family protein [Azospirillaceae bacterium]